MRVLRAADRAAIPWKNGGGVTREVSAMPKGAGFDFDWRLSIAEVQTSGAFSRFPGIDRKLAVIQGRMRLTVDTHTLSELAPHAPVQLFAGEAETSADILEPVIDANLMTRRGVCEGSLEWIEIDRAITIGERHAETILLAVDPLGLPDCDLQPLDAVRYEAGSFATVRPVADTGWILAAKIWRVDAMTAFTTAT